MNDASQSLLCIECGTESPRAQVVTEMKLTVGGEEISVQATVLRCQKCGADYLPLGSGHDPLADAYRIYRERHGMVQPEAIRALRTRYGLTQQELGTILGFGPRTISRYETGALQDTVHDRLLAIARRPEGLLEILRAVPPRAIPSAKRARLTAKLREMVAKPKAKAAPKAAAKKSSKSTAAPRSRR